MYLHTNAMFTVERLIICSILKRQASLARLKKTGVANKNFYSNMTSEKNVYVTRPDIPPIGLELLKNG